MVWLLIAVAGLGQSSADLPTARAAFAAGNYVESYRCFDECYRQAPTTLSVRDQQQYAYASMTVVYRLYYAYLTRGTPATAAEWDRLAELARQAERLDPRLDYVAEVLAAIEDQQRLAAGRKVAQRDR